MKIEPKAPRFHALWKKREGVKDILIMERPSWQQLRQGDGELVPFELSKTPLAGLENTNLIHASVIDLTAESVKISIYREDPKDAPNLIKVDHYSVFEGLPPGLDVAEMIERASTAADPNFQRYATDFVFIIKGARGDDHWLDELPSKVAIAVEGKT